MLWFVIRLIFKTSSVTPDFFNVFNLTLSFSTCSQSFKKICTWELLGANVLKVICYPKMDQKVCLNLVKKDQLRVIVLMNRKLILKVLLKMVAMAASLLR